MTRTVPKRLQGVRSLYEMLPKGAEGGKEFARIVDLLLFHEARRAGQKITIFSDASGDYHGLDSFGGDAFRKHGTTGYQHKFYPSPLSSKHRRDIEESLQHSAEAQRDLKLRKWILVTPQDLIESATRKDGGDVTWFEGLREKLDLKFELEHWGHKKLISLFIETPTLCLFYYPELVPDGAVRRRTIQDTRERYNSNLDTLYRRIEFVGMSVYKQEAARGVPMEHIYIPLSAVPEAADEDAPDLARTDPLSFLAQGARHVVLGDPGSGKSTMLRFLALAGRLKPLQQRYGAKPDDRLPVLVVLRRYADELKTRKNLSLIDYIQENMQGDFNLKSADQGFFEYYLESGQAILLFDGLDELPNPAFKRTVRDQIRTLVTTYPGNTTIVTSRIVGYDTPFRFDDKEFAHHRLTRLQLPEIEQFVKDWYRVRIENKQERDANVDDLIRILRDESQVAIRELAENPLLLTIIALVHRIDAVLPDERVVLYQKCTETLLNTWHTWKFRDLEVKVKVKTERRNRRRMEAIAYWMHCRSIDTEMNQSAIVPYADLKDFLTEYIDESERYRDPEDDPEDLAVEFLEFVKERAGLLIEIGDNQYSFVHLTFQEYLTASSITTNNERAGADGIWVAIKQHCNDPGWHEVIRLLIAGLRSDETQEFLIESILAEEGNGRNETETRLLGGLLVDGIEPAEARREDIFARLLDCASRAVDIKQLSPIVSMLRTCLAKEEANEEAMELAFQTLWKAASDNKQKMSLVLTAAAMNWPETVIAELTGDFLAGEGRDIAFFKLFLGEAAVTATFHPLTQSLELFWSLQDCFSIQSAPLNFIASVCQAVTSALGSNLAVKRAFEQQMAVLSAGATTGPFLHLTSNGVMIALEERSPIYKWVLALDLLRDWARERSLARALERAGDLSLGRAAGLARERVGERSLAWALERTGALDRAPALELDRGRVAGEHFWRIILATPDLYGPILDLLCNIFTLEPRTQWWEALRLGFLPDVPERITIFDESVWKQVERAFEEGEAGETEIYSAAWQLILDSWLYIYEYYKSSDESMFTHLAELTREFDAPPLRIAHCIRDLAYGDRSRADDLASMVKSDGPEYRSIFERCLWRPTAEEEKKLREKNRAR